MSAQQPQDPTHRSPLDFLACSSCHRPLNPSSNSPAVWLTACAHTLCQDCLDQPTPATSAPAHPSEATCPACGQRGAVARLETVLAEGEARDLASCFRPLGELLGEVGMAAEWQLRNLADQLAFFQDKCREQKRMLASLAGKVKKQEGLKGQVEQLTSDNSSLRAQLAAAANLSTQHGYAPQEQQQRLGSYKSHENMPLRGDEQRQRGQKRKAAREPDRDALLLQPNGFAAGSVPPSRAQSRSSGSTFAQQPRQQQLQAQLALPMPPSRLSFTPAQTKEAKQRERASSRQGSSVAAESEVGRGKGQNKALKLGAGLQQFVYNPSRASHRDAAPTPRPQPTASAAFRPSQSRSASRRQQAAPLPPASRGQQRPLIAPRNPADYSSSSAASAGSNPFFYNPPALDPSARVGPNYPQTQDSGYDDLAYAQQQQQAYDEELAEMPPPPLPSSGRFSHPQQQPTRSTFVSARQLQEQQQQQQMYYAPPASPFVARAGAATPMPSAAGYAPLPPSSSTPFGGSTHRQPFRPAGGGGVNGAGGAQGGYRFG
ncbi:hypothetical protein JCM10213_002386 [Rhodosporidiobolus nylandii]